MKRNLNYSDTFKDHRKFEELFTSCYPALCSFASAIVSDLSAAEDIVQEVFVRFWEKSENFSNEHAVKTFLYTSVKNKCLNQLEHDKVVQKHREYSLNELKNEQMIHNRIVEEETHRLIYNAINELPAECKNILLLSMNGLKNREIAEELNISVNTVKTQKKIAYRQLKIRFSDIYLLAGLLFGWIL